MISLVGIKTFFVIANGHCMRFENTVDLASGCLAFHFQT